MKVGPRQRSENLPAEMICCQEKKLLNVEKRCWTEINNIHKNVCLPSAAATLTRQLLLTRTGGRSRDRSDHDAK